MMSPTQGSTRAAAHNSGAAIPRTADHAPSGRRERARRATMSAGFLLAGFLLFPSCASAYLALVRQGQESRGAREAGDRHGAALAAGDFNGDGRDDLAVGAPGEAVGTLAEAGAVVVSLGSNRGITPQGALILTEDDFGFAQAGAEFGYALASGDFNHDGFDDLAVGCPGSNLGMSLPDAGIVYLYAGSASGLSPWHDLTQADAGGALESGDRFGAALCPGNFNGDATPYADLAVGCPGENTGSGAVAWFCGGLLGLITGPDGLFTQTTFGGTSNAGDAFGFSLASGQLLGLFHEDLVVGVPGKDLGGAADAGMVYVVLGGPSGPTTTYRTCDATTGDIGGPHQANARFGHAVAAGRLYDGNFEGIAIGEPGCNGYGFLGVGRVVIGKGGASTLDWTGSELVRIYPTDAEFDPRGNDAFGAVLATGRYDQTTTHEALAIGCPNASRPASIPQFGAGAVGVFLGGPNGPDTQLDRLLGQEGAGEDSEYNDHYGSAITFGAFDLTGRGSIAVGAPDEDSGIGMVHVFAPWRQVSLPAWNSAIALDCEGNYIYALKPFDEVCIASTTKSMTLLLACERTQLPANHPKHVSLTASYTVPDWIRDRIGGSRYDFLNEETLTLRDLLYALMMPSGNDAAYAIADLLTGSDNDWNDGYPGTCQEFVDEMNARAAALGMSSTVFTNPPGLDVGDHHSTPADMMKLARAVMNNPLAAEVVGTSNWTIEGTWRDGTVVKPFTRDLAYGFLMNLQAQSPDFTGIKPGQTPCANRTGLFAASDEVHGVALAGSFGTDIGSDWSTYYGDAGSLVELGIEECGADFQLLAELPPFRLDIPGLSTAQDHLGGGGVELAYSQSELPSVVVELFRSSAGSPTSARVELVRNSETYFERSENLSFGIAPFEGHGDIVFINQGESGARFRVYPSYDPGFTEFTLPPGGRGVLPARTAPMSRLNLRIENLSGDGSVMPMLLSVREEYSFHLPAIPGNAGRILFGELTRPTSQAQETFTLRVRGLDPNGGAMLHAVAHAPSVTVDVPDVAVPTEGSEGSHDSGSALLRMRPAYPNPFSTSTRLAFELRQPARVVVSVYDAQGRRVRHLEKEAVAAGAWSLEWKGTTDAGTPAPAGTYFYRVEVDGRRVDQGKLQLVR